MKSTFAIATSSSRFGENALRTAVSRRRTSLVPSVEGRAVARVPTLAQSWRAQVPVGPNLAGHHPQIAPEIGDGRAPPEPVPVVDAVNHETRPEDQRVRDHRVVFRVCVLLYVEILLYRSFRIGQKRPFRANGRPELLKGVMVVGRNRRDLRVGDRYLWVERREFQMLLVFLGAVMASSEREDHRVFTLQLTEAPPSIPMVR